MITVQETTTWNGNFPNHKYILSDDRRMMHGYIKTGSRYPKLFNPPINFDVRNRTFKVLVKTRDVVEAKYWVIQGSKGNKYTVTLEGNVYACTCPAATFRHGECKHIQQVRSL